MKKRSSICVLVSGGLDSCALVGDLARNRTVVPIFIRQGLRWENVELYWLKKFLSSCRRKPASTIDPGFRRGDVKPLQVFSLPMVDIYGKHWSTSSKSVPGAKTPDSAVYLPGRNPVLIVKAAVYCALHRIPAMAIGSLDHNPFPDATPGFFRAYARVLSMGLGRHIRIEAPYRHLSKVQVIRRGADLPLELSFSCLAPIGKKHCGRCNKCGERKKAFKHAGVMDKTFYAGLTPIPSPVGRGAAQLGVRR